MVHVQGQGSDLLADIKAEFAAARAARKLAGRSHILALCHIRFSEAKAGGEPLEVIRQSYRGFKARWPEVTRADIEAAIAVVMTYRHPPDDDEAIKDWGSKFS